MAEDLCGFGHARVWRLIELRLLPRGAIVAILMPLLYLSTASATFLYRVHTGNGDRDTGVLRVVEPPRSSDRIVVFSPHPDDETLGCGGLIARARRAGARVDVVFFTNGDAFRVAVQREYRLLRVEPDDFVRFAALRQEEARRAVGVLGVPPDHVHFLGYADRGLLEMWTDHWSPENPYISPYTRRDRTIGASSAEPALYCGRDVEADVIRELRAAEPTAVYVTHPSDDHIDHLAASAFVTHALMRLRDEGVPWAQECRLRYYVVHRGDWPVPGGLHPDRRLSPPSEMVGLDCQWYLLPLSADDVALKAKAIGQYASQLGVTRNFLLSFARQTEPQAQVDPADVPQTPDGRIELDGKRSDWSGLAPIALDPVNDNLLRDFQRGGDITALYACKDSRNLYLRIDTFRPTSQSVSMRVLLRAFGADGSADESRFLPIRISPNGQAVGDGVWVARQGALTEIALPLRRLQGARTLAISVETSVAGLLVDRTGYRFVRMR